MAKLKSSVVFKSSNQQQALLLPPSLEELIPSKHLVRVVNEVVESMDISVLLSQYAGGGTSSYHPRILLKVLLYGYCTKIYTGRRIAKALTQDIHFMWLSAMSRPDFRTINNFRSSKAKEVIEVLFKELLDLLIEFDYIKMENYFCDGTSIRADGNARKMVWRKNAERYKMMAEQKCNELLKQIDSLNETEERIYGEQDLEERGENTSVTPAMISERITKLNETIKKATDKKTLRKASGLKKKVEEANSKIKKYERQIRVAGKRGGYNKTDEDASGMMMKNKVEVLPAYNVLAGSEDQFITGISVHQNPSDGSCFKEHLDSIAYQQSIQPSKIIGDAGFGSQQNYELIEQKGIENYLKFSLFHKEQKQSFKKNPYLRENFKYVSEADLYICPNQQELIHQRTTQQTDKKTGCVSTIKEYVSRDCSGCPFYKDCCKSESGKPRIIKFNEKLETFKEQARSNLRSPMGEKLRKQRNIEIESCFGDIKHNMGFRRFHLRGLEKVKTEITLVAMAHNLRKLFFKTIKNAA